MRGQFADNREWSIDPSRPAVVCGTVDMVGSRLLFSGYGVGFKSRPLHAGFLGRDALLVHDEAHLEPAFQRLLTAIAEEQRRCRERFAPLRVIELSATARGEGETFELGDDDRADATVARRLAAVKTLHLKGVDEKAVVDRVGKKALELIGTGRAVLIFLRSVEAVEKVAARLPKDATRQLTGTMRGHERDALVRHAVFQRFRPTAGGDAPKPGTVYLVCTSAGEVGIDMSADDLVCDLSTFDGMAQRLGRVNRYGTQPAAVHVFHPTEFDASKPIDARRELTLGLLRGLGDDASPAALQRLDAKARRAAAAPDPEFLPATDILFDAWALTTVRGKLPGRPPVEPYLHGSEKDQATTAFAWREEVELLTPALLAANGATAEGVLELFPLKPHETLAVPTYGRGKGFEQLRAVAGRFRRDELFAWVVAADGTVEVHDLVALGTPDAKGYPAVPLGGATVLLPPPAGGLREGLLAGDAKSDPAAPYDVSEEWFTGDAPPRKRRARQRSALPRIDAADGMRPLAVFDLSPDAEDGDAPVSRYWHWSALARTADDDGPTGSTLPVTWADHTNQVAAEAARLVSALGLPDELGRAVVLAARLHDLGKKRVAWQRGIGNPNPTDWHAKSGRGWRRFPLAGYRHEFGSLLDALSAAHQEELAALPDGMRDVVLHLVAAHHGRARPHFPPGEDFDLPPGVADPAALAEVPRRFARLQREYGRWGLAYLESLLRAADAAASADPKRSGVLS